MPRRRSLNGFIGFARVSTTAQLDDLNSLRSQTLQLEEFALGLGVEIEIVSASEPAHGPIERRIGFQEVIRRAQARSWGILVTKPCRLSRELKSLQSIDLRKTPVWVVGAGKISRRQLLDGVRSAQEELMQLRADAGSGAARRGKGYHSEAARLAAQNGRHAGAKANGERAFRNRLRVVEFIEQNPSATELRHKELAEALNAAGILNCASERNHIFKPWTVSSLRPVRRDAGLQIAIDEEPLTDFHAQK